MVQFGSGDVGDGEVDGGLGVAVAVEIGKLWVMESLVGVSVSCAVFLYSVGNAREGVEVLRLSASRLLQVEEGGGV